jgi:hypothetical protein
MGGEMTHAASSWVRGVALAVFLLGICGSIAPATPYVGYTFCASGSTGYLLDMSGTVLHTWQASGSAQTCAYLLADGSALFPIQNSSCNSPHHDGAYPSGRFQKISWDGAILWDYRFCDTTARAGYDVEPMPNGNILIPTDASNAAKIFEVQPTGATSGTIVWQCALPDSLTGSGTYMNSVSYNPELDLILIDMQEPQRKLVVINHAVAGGQIVRTYRVSGSGRVHAAAWVHKYFLGTATVMPDVDATAMRLNNLLVVHNGGDRVAEFNRTTGVMTTIPFAFQDHEGSVQRLPNGNTLVTRGGSNYIGELNDAGTVVASMSAPGQIQRAYRYGPTYSGLSQLWPAGVAGPLTVTPVVRFAYDPRADIGRVLFTGQKSVPLEVGVYSVDGRLLIRTSTCGTGTEFSTSWLPNGVYFVDVKSPEASCKTKFFKVR